MGTVEDFQGARFAGAWPKTIITGAAKIVDDRIRDFADKKQTRWRCVKESNP